MIAAVKTGRLLNVDIHPYLGLLVNLVSNFSANKDKEVFFLNTLKITFAPIPKKDQIR